MSMKQKWKNNKMSFEINHHHYFPFFLLVIADERIRMNFVNIPTVTILVLCICQFLKQLSYTLYHPFLMFLYLSMYHKPLPTK